MTIQTQLHSPIKFNQLVSRKSNEQKKTDENVFDLLLAPRLCQPTGNALPCFTAMRTSSPTILDAYHSAFLQCVVKNNQRNAQHSNFYSIPLFFFFELQVQTTFSGLLAIRLSTMFSSQNIYQQINTMAIVFDVSFQFLHSITQSKSQSIVQFQNVSSRVLLTLQPVTKLHFSPTSFEPLVNPQVFLKIEKMFSVFFCVPIIQTSNRPNINGKMPPKKLLLMTH